MKLYLLMTSLVAWNKLGAHMHRPQRVNHLYARFLKLRGMPSAPVAAARSTRRVTAVYEQPVQRLLERGWQLDELTLAKKAKMQKLGLPTTPALLQMVYDEGLRNGWPGEKASWAPYHALLMLGYVGAHEHASDLLPLFEMENDWLSDKLPQVWGYMGTQAEAPLWAYIHDQTHHDDYRALAIRGLQQIANKHPEREGPIVAKMAQFLTDSTADEATLNGHLIFTLNQMEAVSAAIAIMGAFNNDKVDTDVMTI